MPGLSASEPLPRFDFERMTGHPRGCRAHRGACCLTGMRSKDDLSGSPEADSLPVQIGRRSHAELSPLPLRVDSSAALGMTQQHTEKNQVSSLQVCKLQRGGFRTILLGNILTKVAPERRLALARRLSPHSSSFGRFARSNSSTRAAFSRPGSNSKSSSGV